MMKPSRFPPHYVTSLESAKRKAAAGQPLGFVYSDLYLQHRSREPGDRSLTDSPPKSLETTIPEAAVRTFVVVWREDQGTEGGAAHIDEIKLTRVK